GKRQGSCSQKREQALHDFLREVDPWYASVAASFRQQRPCQHWESSAAGPGALTHENDNIGAFQSSKSGRRASGLEGTLASQRPIDASVLVGAGPIFQREGRFFFGAGFFGAGFFGAGFFAACAADLFACSGSSGIAAVAANARSIQRRSFAGSSII